MANIDIIPKCPLKDLPDVPDITDPAKDEYHLEYSVYEDVYLKYPVLSWALASPISGFAVKYLLIPGEKRPQVCLELNFAEPFKVKDGHSKYVGCVISMIRHRVASERTLHGMLHPDAAGICLIKMITESAPTANVTSVLFRFQVRGHWDLHEAAKVICGGGPGRATGLPKDLKGTLCRFHFKHQWYFEEFRGFSGCRDWMQVLSSPLTFQDTC
jgi:hypothetical protein